MGQYTDNNLMNNEMVIYEAHLHWIHFLTLRSLLSLFILPLIDQYTHEQVVTNFRVIVKEGWLSVNSVELNINQVESVKVYQTVFGRLLNYGAIEVVGSGGTSKIIEDISDPLLFRRHFMEVQNANI
ncbi:MAG: hypothetical protein CMC13_14835 [Flavobacteriaceae bacterium]|nr:hypothetical protein [Flavobacteriaceae bacterium]|tara:strand:+ start:86924 stop:87304 length:381 start_codon:yes stop_codon:yes gene_type:complete